MAGIKLKHNQLMEGVEEWDTVDGVHVLQIQYTADPAKRTKEWLQETLRGTTDRDFRQEYLIEWNVMKGSPWYEEFNDKIHIADEPLEPIPGLPIVTGFDYGLTPATIFVQVSPLGQIRVLHPELQSWESGMVAHAEKVKSAMSIHFPGYKFHHYGDPAGNQRAQTDERTCVQLLREDFGIHVMNGPVAFNQRDFPLRKALTTLVKGQPQLLVDPRCEWLIEAMLGGYRRQEINGEITDKLENNKYTHIVDALGYAVSMIKYQGEIPLKGKFKKLGAM